MSTQHRETALTSPTVQQSANHESITNMSSGNDINVPRKERPGHGVVVTFGVNCNGTAHTPSRARATLGRRLAASGGITRRTQPPFDTAQR